MTVIQFNPDGSGMITAPSGAVFAFAPGLTPSDLAALAQSFVAANPAPLPPPMPQPINVTVQAPPVTINQPPVTVNTPDLTPVDAHITQIFNYLPQLQQAVAKIPGAAVIPIAPTPS